MEAVALPSKGGTKADAVTAMWQDMASRDQVWSVHNGLSHVPGSHGESFTSKTDQEATGGRGLAPSGS